MLCIVYVLALLGCASGLNVTCAAFDALPKLTYNNVAPQGQASAIIAFAPDTTPQLLDAFRDALVCRGAAVDPPNYNTHTLTGFVSLAFKSPLEASTHVLAVDVAGMATVLAASPAPSLPAHEASSSVSKEPALSGLDSADHSSAAHGLSAAILIWLPLAAFLF